MDKNKNIKLKIENWNEVSQFARFSYCSRRSRYFSQEENERLHNKIKSNKVHSDIHNRVYELMKFVDSFSFSDLLEFTPKEQSVSLFVQSFLESIGEQLLYTAATYNDLLQLIEKFNEGFSDCNNEERDALMFDISISHQESFLVVEYSYEVIERIFVFLVSLLANVSPCKVELKKFFTDKQLENIQKKKNVIDLWWKNSDNKTILWPSLNIVTGEEAFGKNFKTDYPESSLSKTMLLLSENIGLLKQLKDLRHKYSHRFRAPSIALASVDSESGNSTQTFNKKGLLIGKSVSINNTPYKYGLDVFNENIEMTRNALVLIEKLVELIKPAVILIIESGADHNTREVKYLEEQNDWEYKL